MKNRGVCELDEKLQPAWYRREGIGESVIARGEKGARRPTKAGVETSSTQKIRTVGVSAKTARRKGVRRTYKRH